MRSKGKKQETISEEALEIGNRLFKHHTKVTVKQLFTVFIYVEKALKLFCLILHQKMCIVGKI